jgi:hypothetical protein
MYIQSGTFPTLGPFALEDTYVTFDKFTSYDVVPSATLLTLNLSPREILQIPLEITVVSTLVSASSSLGQVCACH